MKKILILSVIMLMNFVMAFAADQAKCVYVWTTGSNAVYLIEDNPVVTYEGNKAILTVDGEKVLTLPLVDDAELVITYGEYVDADLVKLNNYGYATYSGETDMKVEIGAEVCGLKIVNGEAKVTAQATNKIPVFNGVLLRGQPRSLVVLTKTTACPPLVENDLKPTTYGLIHPIVDFVEGSYALNGKTFKKYVQSENNGGKFAPKKAYLPAPIQLTGKAMSIIGEIDQEFLDAITSAEDEVTTTTVQKIGKYIVGGTLYVVKGNKMYTTDGKEVK